MIQVYEAAVVIRPRAQICLKAAAANIYSMLETPIQPDWVVITPDPLPVVQAMDWATTPACGAVVTFSGVVRDYSEDRFGVTAITYEAYEEVAVERLAAVAGEARERYEGIERLVVWHRTGRLELSELSVLVVVSSAHRDVAFAAGRFVIDTLKVSVPIWKREHWEAGDDWAESALPLRPVTATTKQRIN